LQLFCLQQAYIRDTYDLHTIQSLDAQVNYCFVPIKKYLNIFCSTMHAK